MSTILVVDDSAVDRRLVGGLLQKKTVCTVQFAANGVEALARMQAAVPDLIITDLTMPAMDGLQLVREVRRHCSHVPVILMTAHGSENLAIEALEQGAASYVPKSCLADKLHRTVDEVLSMARADRSHDHLVRCLNTAQFAFSLENEPALIDPLVDMVQKTVAGMQFCDFTGRLQIGVALKEALLNALFHGNLELHVDQTGEAEDDLLQEKDLSLVEQRRAESPYCDRRVFVDIRLTRDEARFVIRDEGPGFDVRAVPRHGDSEALEPRRGRGLSLMQTFMDELRFNQIGNEVTMVKHRPSDAGEGQA